MHTKHLVVIAAGWAFSGAVSVSGTLISFEQLPSGAIPVTNATIGTGYADWGITRFTGSWTGYPIFRIGQYSSQGFYAQSASASGAKEWIDVEFSIPVTEVVSDMCTAPGYGVYLYAYNAQGALIGGGYSGGAPSTFWIRGFKASTVQPIARLRWETAVANVVLCLDNLQFTPEPATLAMLIVGAWGLRPRRTRR